MTRPIALCLLVAAAGCSLLYPLDYRTAAPDATRDLPAPDAAPDALPDAPADGSQPACPTGFDRCSGASCTDIRTNTSHCGRCGNVCALANATPTCEAAMCIVASCNPGFADCDGDPATGCETNTSTSVARCGRCDRACPTAGGTPACRDGVCRVAMCAEGFADCDGTDANGCETDTRASLTHCGACGRMCSRPNATARCQATGCVTGDCDAGFADCDMDPANGCETNTRTTVAHCGRCGRACSSAGGVATCAAGDCAIRCGAGRGDCDSNIENGCERNLLADADHCGSCRITCSGVTPTCSAGACATECRTGATACSGACVDLQTNPSHCGACGRLCPATGRNALPSCTMGVCGITCVVGFGNCNLDPADGCETPLLTSPSHCGRCGGACPTPTGGAASCSGGACGVTCAAGFDNCDGNAGNGCEVVLASSVTNCGVCGRVCTTPRGTPVCRTGACAIESCNGGFGDCNASASDGCETPLDTTLAHCGGCNRVCTRPNATPVCTNGECRVMACNAGFADCNNDPRDGCEVTLATNAAHCGRCDNDCAGGRCADSVCCGAAGQRCCRGSECVTRSSTCVLDTCQTTCGAAGQPCCSLSCGAGLQCGGGGATGRGCSPCGGSMELCCRMGGPCQVTLTCPPDGRCP